MAFLFSSSFRPSSPPPTAHSGLRRPERRRAAAVSGREVKTASGVEVDRAQLEIGLASAQKREKKLPGAEAGGLDVLYDDGFGTVSVKDYFAAAKEVIKPDGGPPRWFCPVECGAPIKGAPLLLFLPGMDGTGFGLILHHKPLGKVFEVRCLHIPANDRTPFEGLVNLVENSVKKEHAVCPNKPIYLVGDSFGGCLALAVAARNPTIDLILVLVNPATSFGKTQLQPLFPVLEALPSDLHITVPYLLSFIMGDPLKMAMATVSEGIPSPRALEDLSSSLTSMLPLLSDLADIIPRETLLWKLKLLKSAAAYANSRLHAIEAEVVVVASGKDNLLPSGDEAERLKALLKKCKVRYFKDNGHTLLLEGGINLLTVIKSTVKYRRSRRHDFVEDYLPPTRSEFIKICEQDNRWFLTATSPVILSTLEDGRIVRGLAGIPDKGPVIMVGYHMLMGFELTPLYREFLREKKVVLHGMAHPILFSTKNETPRREMSFFDNALIFGAIPVTAGNMYKLLSRKSFVLLYPGGAREALHRKGEEYKLFWPDQPEFVRMAARFGAKIVPFGVVGEDDIFEYILDYNDQKNLPYLREWVEEINQDGERLRADFSGEIANQEMYLPGLLPKLPGRFYYLFGKPFETQGQGILEDKNKALTAYLQIKSEVERLMSYLQRKREEDPYRNVIQRSLYQASWGFSKEAPTFEVREDA